MAGIIREHIEDANEILEQRASITPTLRKVLIADKVIGAHDPAHAATHPIDSSTSSGNSIQ